MKRVTRDVASWLRASMASNKKSIESLLLVSSICAVIPSPWVAVSNSGAVSCKLSA